MNKAPALRMGFIYHPGECATAAYKGGEMEKELPRGRHPVAFPRGRLTTVSYHPRRVRQPSPCKGSIK
jgi:hypothetical protein